MKERRKGKTMIPYGVPRSIFNRQHSQIMVQKLITTYIVASAITLVTSIITTSPLGAAVHIELTGV
jgi:hypothetical protein